MINASNRLAHLLLLSALASAVTVGVSGCFSDSGSPSALRPTAAGSLGPAPAKPPTQKPNEIWTGSWAAAPQPQRAGSAIQNQTILEFVHISTGGAQLRVHLSNAFGSGPVQLGSVHVGIRQSARSIVSGSDRVVTFQASPTVTIPAGAEIASDPVALAMPDLGDLALSIYVENAVESPTIHVMGLESTLLSKPGNFTDPNLDFPLESTVQTGFFLSRVDVLKPTSKCAVVTLGDSITDGVGSDVDSDTRWPDFLARRLIQHSIEMGVLNEGIGYNKILSDQSDLGQPSESALKRFSRDVLNQTHVCYLVILEGINDIGQTPEGTDATAYVAQLIAADQKMIDLAHQNGIKVIGATLTPIGLSGYGTPTHELMRTMLNQWIRKGGAFDDVADFDAASRDPVNQDQLYDDYDSGDHLHPNDQGYEAMADAIDLSLLKMTALKNRR